LPDHLGKIAVNREIIPFHDIARQTSNDRAAAGDTIWDWRFHGLHWLMPVFRPRPAGFCISVECQVFPDLHPPIETICVELDCCSCWHLSSCLLTGISWFASDLLVSYDKNARSGMSSQIGGACSCRAKGGFPCERFSGRSSAG